MFSEKLTVAFITLALVMGGGLAYVTVQDLHQGRTGGTAAASGDGTTTDQATDQATTDASAGGGGGTTGGTSGGGAAAAGNVSNSQAASGVSGDQILVGGIFDMTGPVDSSVERDTVRAYFNKVNAQGGVNGRKLVLTYCDSQYDNVQTHNCSNEMVSAHVLAVVGWTAPKGEDNEAKFLAQQQGIPLVGGLGTPEEYRYALSYPVSTPFARTGIALADEFARAGYKHPAIITLTDVPWIAPVRQALLDALHSHGITETHIEDATATDPDYTGHVGNLEHAGSNCASPPQTPGACPDSLIAALDPYSYSRLFQAMDRVSWHPPVVAGGLDKGNVQGAYGDQLNQAQSAVPFLSPYDHPSNGTVVDYNSSVQRFYPQQVPALDIYTQISWTAAMVFVEAVKRAGSNLTRQSLVTALNSIQNFDTGWSKPISYSAGGSHDPNHCFTYVKHDGQPANSGGTWHTYTDWQCF